MDKYTSVLYDINGRTCEILFVTSYLQFKFDSGQYKDFGTVGIK